MNETYATFINEKIAIRQLIPSDVNDLLKTGFIYKLVLDQALGNRIRKMVGLMPHTISLVAYHVKEKRALGFLSLVEHTSSIYSIKYLFTDPNLRHLGIATGLLNYSVSLARERGGKKVYLNANSSESSLVDFYAKRGFGLIIDNSMVWVGGSPVKLRTVRENRLTSVNVGLKTSNDYLFSIYEKIMGKTWIDFFNIKTNNLINGFSQDYRQFFFSKYVFITDSADLLVLVYKIPMQSNGFVELYAASDTIIPSVIGDLSEILCNIGMKYAKITAFNLNGTEFFDLLKKLGFDPFQAKILGKSL